MSGGLYLVTMGVLQPAVCMNVVLALKLSAWSAGGSPLVVHYVGDKWIR